MQRIHSRKSAPSIAAALSLICAGMTACALADLPSDTRPPEAATVSQAFKTDVDAAIDALIAEMTLEEKIGQMTLFSANWAATGAVNRDTYVDDIKAGKVGAMFSVYTAAKTRELQRIAVEETRLGIPLLFGFDVIHGHRTIFPISLGEAASWDLQAIEKGARVAASEATAEGLHWTFAPMVDVARDPRWGRVSEGAGEDVFLSSEIARARVRGFQGNDLNATDTLLATVKHFAAYGAAQAGRDYHSTDMSERELRETYLPPFKAAIDAGAGSVMTAFNDLNGTPATGNSFLLTDVLRGEWGFEGFVVSDYSSINELVPHGYARDDGHAGELAVDAGVDMDMQGAVYLRHLQQSITEGRISERQVDTAVRRILTMKYRLGLFADPYRYSSEARQSAEILSAGNLAAARDVARRSMVLLKNANNTLPLKKSIDSIALVGPLADSKTDLIGSWSAAGDRKQQPVSILQGLREKWGDDVVVRYAKGASYAFDAVPDAAATEEAVRIAKQSDVVIAVMGEKWNMSGEAASRTELSLPGNQQDLLKALRETGKPIVLVLLNGRPLAIEWADRNIDAILEAWYPGTMGGHAVADILVGDYNPSGKLPITFPRNAGQIPIHYNMKNTGRPYDPEQPGEKFRSRYLVAPNSPLYPFGHGLSYARFTYSEVQLSRNVLRSGETLRVSVAVKNDSQYDGEEVVQLYVQDIVGSVTRPVKELKGFEKIRLASGEQRDVHFDIVAEDLAFYRHDMSYGTEAGMFRVFIGGSSEDTQSAGFELATQTFSTGHAPKPANARAFGDAVADWQLQALDDLSYLPTFVADSEYSRGWIKAAFYIGLDRFTQKTNDTRFLRVLERLSRNNGFDLGRARWHADDQAIAAVYVGVASRLGDAELLGPVVKAFDELLSDRATNDLEFTPAQTGVAAEGGCQRRWCWADALFMAPPVWAAVSHVTGDDRYRQYAVEESKASIDYLFDADSGLFFRDSRYFEQRTRNGKKVFWSRGNGWVFAGLARFIELLPTDDPDRPFFVDVYREMASALVKLQRDDGYWPTSLADAELFTNPETSGTGFIGFGLAWGLNNDVLVGSEYEQATDRAWQAMTAAVDENGRLGWVQQVGKAPESTTADSSQLYAVGAFLLLASEMIDRE